MRVTHAINQGVEPKNLVLTAQGALPPSPLQLVNKYKLRKHNTKCKDGITLVV